MKFDMSGWKPNSTNPDNNDNNEWLKDIDHGMQILVAYDDDNNEWSWYVFDAGDNEVGDGNYCINPAEAESKARNCAENHWAKNEKAE